MNDGWEHKYGLNPNSASDAGSDADGDGRTNLQEYNAGSNPVVYNAISVTVYKYDNSGQVLKETTQDSADVNVAVVEYKYDSLGRKWSTRQWENPQQRTDSNDRIVLTSYDVQGNVKINAVFLSVNGIG